MSDAVLAILLLSLVLIGIVAAQVMRWLSRRSWQEHEELDFLGAAGFQRISDRWLIDSRIVRYRGTRLGANVRVESGAGPSRIFARVDIDFPTEIPLGVRISSEHDEGLLTRVMRLREVEIGMRRFDTQFILLTRNEDRLKTLLDRSLREMLMRLRENARDMRVDEEGVHFNISGEVSGDEFLGLLDDASRVAQATYSRATAILDEEREAADSSVFTPVPGALKAVEETLP